MESFIDKCKSIIEIFAKQTSLNILVFSGAITCLIAFYFPQNKPILYICVGLWTFLITNLAVKYIPIIREKFQITKLLNDPQFQRKALIKLDDSSLELLWHLYFIYPESAEYDSTWASVNHVIAKKMVISSNQYDFSLDRPLSLQPWVYKAITKNKDIFSKFEKEYECY